MHPPSICSVHRGKSNVMGSGCTWTRLGLCGWLAIGLGLGHTCQIGVFQCCPCCLLHPLQDNSNQG
jgi:hypothetical protein